MRSPSFSQTATGVVAGLGRTAHELIDLYREGGETIAENLAARWDEALAQAGQQLTPETRHNAARAREAAGQLYAQGLAVSAGGARVLVDILVGATIAGIHFAAGPRRPS